MSTVSPKIAWVSGTKGTYGRTIDAGKTWTVGKVPGADKLDFRDVEAFSESTAYLLSAGPGKDSRIYKTTDGGKLWSLQFENSDPAAFGLAGTFGANSSNAKPATPTPPVKGTSPTPV